MDVSNLSEIATRVLTSEGWSAHRNMSEKLNFPKEKNIVPGFLNIAKSFAYLKVEFEGYSGRECLYFDLDESDVSKDLRAIQATYFGKDDPEWHADPDYCDTEDFAHTNEIQNCLGRKCSRIGFLEEDLGVEIYLCDDGRVYVSHWMEPVHWADSFTEFLNRVIVNE